MQKVAAYLLERRDEMDQPTRRASETATIKVKLTEWLRTKGATSDGSSGSYTAEDRSNAQFMIEEATDPPRAWWLMRLEEVTAEGRRFVASISVTTANSSVAVYASLEAGSDATQINPVDIDPKTPKIIRTLLNLPGQWYHGASQLQKLQRIEGFERGGSLAANLVDPARTVPFIVLTEDNGELALPALDRALAHDVAGLANVVVLDQEGTWALTDYLGPGFRCFGGAVRIYWPRLDQAGDPSRHPRWTAARLRGANNEQAHNILERFRRQVRATVMRASAFSVVRPKEIDEIRTYSSRKTFAEMKARASSLADFQVLADCYAVDNDKLRAEHSESQNKVNELEMRIVEQEARYSALKARAEHSERQLRDYESTGLEIEPDPDTEVPPPQSGEIRYYKKKYSTPAHDVMVAVADCGCNNWENAPKAEKAKKGVMRFEGDRSDWKTFQHCASCEGGGMWKIRW